MNEQATVEHATCRRCNRHRDGQYLEPAGGLFDPHFVCKAKNSCKKSAKGLR